MKHQRILTCVGIALLVGLFFFAQGKMITGLPELNEAGEITGSYTGSLLPPLLLGLGAAAAMWLVGLRGRERTVLEWIPAILVSLALPLLTGMPLLGGRYPEGNFYLSLLTYAILGVAVLDAIEAAVRKRILGFRPMAALVPAVAALCTGIAPYLLDAFAVYRAEQTFSPGPGIPHALLVLYIAGLHALCLLSGLALLPFARPRTRTARWAALSVGAVYVLLYALFYFWTDAPRIPWFSQCFDWPGNLCLPAGLVFAGLRPAPGKGERT
ncbi:MAG: hypothetical protein ACOX83_11265 [Candidatus Spyradocola sp.]